MGKKSRRSSMAGSLQQKEEQNTKTSPLKEAIPNSNSTSTNAMLTPTATHLEKMGRELKCPICLSLLNQAASLTCNHVFCNVCILRSIKSASVCPVCKVPCSRREVRPAPHMDSLVNIYKSMEVAAGINIFVSQPSVARDSTDDQDKENKVPCQNDLKQKPPIQTQVKRKKVIRDGPKPSRLSVVSSHEVRENTNPEAMEHKSPDQVIPSPHRPVKHSFPTKKRVQVSLYPPGSVDETPPRTVKKMLKSKAKTLENDAGDIDNNLPFASLDNVNFDPDNQIGFVSDHRAGTVVMSSIKDPPLSDRVRLDDLGNPILSPFFWLREHESGEADCAQLLTSQPTQVTQITQGSPFEHLSFSDLKDSDDECYHKELQSDEGDIGVTVPDTFDSEMFEWTQKPCSPELTFSPRKQQALDGVENDTLTCANIETGGVLKKPCWKEKVRPINSDEQACLKRKINGNIALDARSEADNVEKIGKKRRRMSAKGNGKNVKNEILSPVGDSVACSIAERSSHASNKELHFTTDDIFNVMFGLSANEFATDNSAAVKSQSCSEFQKQDLQNLPDSYMNDSKQDQPHATLTLTKECSLSNERVDCGSNLGPATEADPLKMQPQVSGRGCGSEGSAVTNEVICGFCRTSGNSKDVGEMMHYSDGRPLPEHKEMPSNVVHVHKICAEWAPDVYFKGDCIMNLEEEVARGVKIKCSMCGLRGAALGCCFAKCHKSFHVPCALSNPECRWDIDNFVMLCPTHSCRKFPKESKTPRSSKRNKTRSSREQIAPINGTPCRSGPSTTATQALAGSDTSQPWTWPSGLSSKWVLCGSALDTAQKDQLNNFANLVGATISKIWSPTVTHVVASTDASGACRRTLKFLMAILEGKWVLRADWIAACVKVGHPVDEELFQITHDIHDTYEGPKRGRERVEKKAPRLFEGLTFYLSGEFASSLKGYLQDLVSAAGGLVLHRKPIMDQPDCYHTIVLYSVELPQTSKHIDKDKIVERRLKEAKSLAHTFGAQFAAHTWVLESIAACQLQPTCNNNGYN